MDDFSRLFMENLVVVYLILFLLVTLWVILKRLVFRLFRIGIDEKIRDIENLEQNKGHHILSVAYKYYCQRKGITPPITPIPDSATEERKESLRKHHEWTIDGQPTGIKNDKMFHKLQRHILGLTMWSLEK